MSEEEQILIKGRLVHDLEKAKTNRELLRTKLWSLLGDMEWAYSELCVFAGHPDIEYPEAALSRIPDAATIRVTCAELRAESKRYEVLRVQASHLRL